MFLDKYFPRSPFPSTVPPNEPIITDQNGEILATKSVIGPYNEGDKLVLICQVEGGKRLPWMTTTIEMAIESRYNLIRRFVCRSALFRAVPRARDIARRIEIAVSLTTTSHRIGETTSSSKPKRSLCLIPYRQPSSARQVVERVVSSG